MLPHWKLHNSIASMPKVLFCVECRLCVYRSKFTASASFVPVAVRWNFRPKCRSVVSLDLNSTWCLIQVLLEPWWYYLCVKMFNMICGPLLLVQWHEYLNLCICRPFWANVTYVVNSVFVFCFPNRRYFVFLLSLNFH